MPIFEFKCIKCENQFEKLFVNSADKADLSCPKCHSQDLQRVVSQTNFTMGVGPGGNQPKITAKSCGGENKCMTLELPGHSR